MGGGYFLPHTVYTTNETVFLLMFVLQSPNCVASPQIYCQLLAIYLLQRDL